MSVQPRLTAPALWLLAISASACGPDLPDGAPFRSPGDGSTAGDGAVPFGSGGGTAVPPLNGSGGSTNEGSPELPLDADGNPIDPDSSDPLVQPGDIPDAPAGGTANLFTELLGIPEAEVDEKVVVAVNRFFGIGTGESTTPNRNQGYRVYYELPQDPSLAFIWAADTNDIRSEGMSYGMMIAVQMDMQEQFDRLWKFARTYMQFPGDAQGNVAAWRYYFKWQGSVNTSNASNWTVSYAGQTGPAPDGEEYFAAALYLADRRWGSAGGVNYQADADNLSHAMIANVSASGRTAVINAGQNLIVFYPQGNTANFSDPSYNLPAFYDLFALDGPTADAERWRAIAESSRQFLVRSAHPTTGLHPDYANFNGTPNSGGSGHDRFMFDAWRVVMNMAVDFAWFSGDMRMKAQVEKYLAFFGSRLTEDNVQNQIFDLDGSNGSDGGSTALTATLASGALASSAANRAEFVDNLWRVRQQQGEYRYYQESVYLLGLLSTAGRFGYEWSAP